MIMNPWLNFSIILLGIWILIWIVKPSLRREMFWVSIFTMPFGLTEPLFVPEYWNPPSLFDLAAKTGFDIESLIFSFAIGGVGAVLYGVLVKVKHHKISKHEKYQKKHRFHLLALTSPILVFLLLYFLTKLNPVYSASIAMFVGGVTAILCRSDLKEKIWIGGIAFFCNIFYILSII